MKHVAVPRLSAIAALVIVTLTLAACSDDDGGGSTASSGGADAAAEPFGSGCSTGGDAEQMMTEPVVTAAANDPQLTSFAGDVDLAGLTEMLNSAQALTVFAPTNDAFMAAADADPEGMEAMMADPTGEFASLLEYHVVEGELMPDALTGEHETLQGDTLSVEGSGESFTVNGANVVCGNVHTDNATVYVIDEVLHP